MHLTGSLQYRACDKDKFHSPKNAEDYCKDDGFSVQELKQIMQKNLLNIIKSGRNFGLGKFLAIGRRLKGLIFTQPLRQ